MCKPLIIGNDDYSIPPILNHDRINLDIRCVLSDRYYPIGDIRYVIAVPLFVSYLLSFNFRCLLMLSLQLPTNDQNCSFKTSQFIPCLNIHVFPIGYIIVSQPMMFVFYSLMSWSFILNYCIVFPFQKLNITIATDVNVSFYYTSYYTYY